MRKTILTMAILAAAVCLGFADEGDQSVAATAAPKKTVREVTLKTAAVDFVIGKVNYVIPADLLTRPRSKIKVTDALGNPVEFTVKALAVIYDSTGRFLAFDNVKPGQEVQVNYIGNSDGTKEAAAIKILK